MATNSIDNPAPIDNIDTFNPEEWANSTKNTNQTYYASLSSANIFTNTNTFLYNNQPYINGNIVINNSFYLNSGSGYITNASTIINTPLYPIYIVNLTSNLTITLPTPDDIFEGCTIWFRRVGSSSWSLNNSFNILNKDFTTSTTLLDSTTPNNVLMLICSFSYTTSTYVWIKVYLN